MRGWCCVVLMCGMGADNLRAETLPARIDGLIEAAAGQPVAVVCDDAAFCRRVFLDFAGRIPTRDELLAFQADNSAGKRLQLIDRLLASPEYIRRMRDVLHVQLMERLGEHDEWTKFLETSVTANTPWNEFVRTMLQPGSEDEPKRGAAFFLTKRLENYGQQPVDLPALTRDVGRLFLGVDLQCAQCHDHLFVDDYKQVDFQGLHTFLQHTFIRQDVKFPAVGEKLVDKKTEFMSVFVKEAKQTGPRLPFGPEVEIAVFTKGEEFATPPDRAKNFLGQPKFSPLTELAARLPTAENPYFVRNAVNRAWCLLMGRGLIHPLDFQHAKNPPSHPEVLDLLATEFVAHQFDRKWLLRELAQTRTYQRSSVLPDGRGEPPPDRYVVALEKPLSAEQLAESTWRATGHTGDLSAEARKKFLAAYANPPREPEGDFAPSVKAALFLSHDATVLSWLQPKDTTLVERLQAETDLPKAIETIYQTVLSRSPTAEETTSMTAFVNEADNRSRALGDVIWALMNTTEFGLNY